MKKAAATTAQRAKMKICCAKRYCNIRERQHGWRRPGILWRLKSKRNVFVQKRATMAVVKDSENPNNKNQITIRCGNSSRRSNKLLSWSASVVVCSAQETMRARAFGPFALIDRNRSCLSFVYSTLSTLDRGEAIHQGSNRGWLLMQLNSSWSSFYFDQLLLLLQTQSIVWSLELHL